MNHSRRSSAVTVSLAAPGGALALLPPQAAVAVELQPILRGEPGPAGSPLESYTAATALSGHLAVTLDALGRATAADCRTAGHAASVLGVTVGAVTAGNAATVRASGLLESPGWGLAPDQPVYLGESGALVQSIPVSALFTKPIGRAVSATAVLIDIQPAIFLA
jgi:hypothetical protein